MPSYALVFQVTIVQFENRKKTFEQDNFLGIDSIACFVCDECVFNETLSKVIDSRYSPKYYYTNYDWKSYEKQDCRVNQNVLINGTWKKERVPAKYCVKIYGTSGK